MSKINKARDMPFIHSSNCEWHLFNSHGLAKRSLSQHIPWGLTLQFESTLSHKLGQIFKVITCCNAKTADKVLRCDFQVTISIVNWGRFIFGPAEIGITGNRGGPIELAETFLGFRLRRRIKSFPSEEFIRRNALLGTKSRFGLC